MTAIYNNNRAPSIPHTTQGAVDARSNPPPITAPKDQAAGVVSGQQPSGTDVFCTQDPSLPLFVDSVVRQCPNATKILPHSVCSSPNLGPLANLLRR